MRTFCWAIFGLLILGSTAKAEALYHWTQPIGEELQSFRAIVEGDLCPLITVDGTPREMQRRVGPAEDWPHSVCTYQSDRRVLSASLGDRTFPLTPTDAQRILLIGDTGCRLKEGSPIQHCENPEDWPFAQISEALAKVEADIAIHLGDYHYRETECPDPALCGTVYGYNWDVWEADFFAPAQAMLSAHPFVMVRGNHEKCSRAWMGFIRHLSVEPMVEPLLCDNYYPPFLVSFEDLHLAVLDSSTRSRSNYTWDRLRAMREQFLEVLPFLERETWILTHAPLWGYGNKEYDPNDMGTMETIQREAYGDMIPRIVSAVVAGDIHFAQVVSTEDNPVQITFGNGGVALYATPEGLHDNLEVGYGVEGDVFGYEGFGFGLVERGKPDVPVTFFDQSGAQVGLCKAGLGANSCTVD